MSCLRGQEGNVERAIDNLDESPLFTQDKPFGLSGEKVFTRLRIGLEARPAALHTRRDCRGQSSLRQGHRMTTAELLQEDFDSEMPRQATKKPWCVPHLCTAL